jgi:hypothetical protein
MESPKSNTKISVSTKRIFFEAYTLRRKRARKAETLKKPSLCLKWRAAFLSRRMPKQCEEADPSRQYLAFLVFDARWRTEFVGKY